MHRATLTWSRAPIVIFVLLLVCFASFSFAIAAPVQVVEQKPLSVITLPNGDLLLDFGRVAFGNLLLNATPGLTASITVRFGEAMRDGRIDQTPPGSVRYAVVTADLSDHAQIVAPHADPRNTRPPAVLTDPTVGILLPFRWVEITGWPKGISPDAVRRRAVFDAAWRDDAASFHSSDPMLDRVWELSHYSIKATTFAGIFVDGDRERLAYEADAYLNQMSYYAGSPSSQMERDTFDRLMKYPTWPTEWAPQIIFIAYADWMQTGDTKWLAQHYEWLKTKLLSDRVDATGLVTSTPVQMRRGDIVDWPAGERDGFVFTSVNTVVNAFYLRALDRMHQLALALGKTDEAQGFAERRAQGLASFQRLLFNSKTGLYRDGIGTDHTSLHANLFPLDFDLVPQENREHIADWLAHRGMRGSPYAAQYLLEALFKNGQAQAAITEITAPGDRSWRHMVESGTTVTWEAWDQRYKPNQDWTHAWGAAPANLLPRFVLGVQVTEPGWRQAIIAPHPGGLQFAKGTLPTPRGEIHISWHSTPNFALSAELPQAIRATVRLPSMQGSHGVWQDGHPIAAHQQDGSWMLNEAVTGHVNLEVR